MTLEEQAAKIFQIGRAKFREHQMRLDQVGLSFSKPELTVMRHGSGTSTVEFRVEFLHDDQIVDIIELFILREGVLVSSEDEIGQWIAEDVSDVIDQFKSSGS